MSLIHGELVNRSGSYKPTTMSYLRFAHKEGGQVPKAMPDDGTISPSEKTSVHANELTTAAPGFPSFLPLQGIYDIADTMPASKGKFQNKTRLFNRFRDLLHVSSVRCESKWS